jgi:hypothetical protein
MVPEIGTVLYIQKMGHYGTKGLVKETWQRGKRRIQEKREICNKKKTKAGRQMGWIGTNVLYTVPGTYIREVKTRKNRREIREIIFGKEEEKQ